MEKKLIIMVSKESILFNISEKHKTFTITPPSTGSRTFCKILNNFEFHTYELCNNNLNFKKNGVTHNHTFSLFPNHEDYKLIMTGRNPYSRMVSSFRRSLQYDNQVIKKFNLKIDFTDFIYDQFYSDEIKKRNKLSTSELSQLTRKDIHYPSFNRFFINYSDFSITPNGVFDRKIDYKVRLDSLEEDYRSIDFIKNSDYYKNGLLDLVLSEKIGLNSLISPHVISGYNLPLNWEEYYTQETADIVYNNGFNYFKTFEFERDSWKK
jgi:hypothetical protein